ncbi:MAG: VOC family protein, partial [Bacteroidaceae bacterium]|nr:VOC family protein [Bacteroidaceae bacterium]
MKISKIEHLGIAVQNIAEVLPYYTDVLGLEFYNEDVVEAQQVTPAVLIV